MKPTHAELLGMTCRAERVFQFSFPLIDPNDPKKGYQVPDQEADAAITEKLLKTHGVKGVKGPLWNGMLLVEIDDTFPSVKFLPDDYWRGHIAGIILEHWKE